MELGSRANACWSPAAPRASVAPSSMPSWPKAPLSASAPAMPAGEATRSRSGGPSRRRVSGTALDVTDDAGAQEMDRRLCDDGGIDHFVANVSALGTETRTEGWRKAIDIDLVATVNAVLHARPHLETRGKGATLTIIGTASLVEVSGPTRPTVRSRRRWCRMVKSLAIEMAPKGVRANMVSPGTILEDGNTWGRQRDAGAERYTRMLAATRWAAWARHRKWRLPSCSWPARRPRS